MKRIFLLIVVWLLLVAAAPPDPVAPCYGPGVELEPQYETVAVEIGWPGYACQVSFEAGGEVQVHLADVDDGYFIQGIGTRQVVVSACPQCSPIDRLWIYYVELSHQVYIPLLQ